VSYRAVVVYWVDYDDKSSWSLNIFILSDELLLFLSFSDVAFMFQRLYSCSQLHVEISYPGLDSLKLMIHQELCNYPMNNFTGYTNIYHWITGLFFFAECVCYVYAKLYYLASGEGFAS
jgi:hypothetical protein